MPVSQMALLARYMSSPPCRLIVQAETANCTGRPCCMPMIRMLFVAMPNSFQVRVIVKKPIQLIKASATQSKQNSYKPKGFTICSFASKQTNKQNQTPLYNKVRVAITVPTCVQVRPQRESQASLNKVDTSNHVARSVRHT